MRILLFLSIFVLFVNYIQGGNLHLNKELEKSSFLQVKVGLVTNDDKTWKIFGSKQTELKFDQKFQLASPSFGEIEVLIYHSKYDKNIGYKHPNGTISLCCSETLQTEGICDEVGKVIRSNNVHSEAINFNAGINTNFNKKFEDFSQGGSGVYYIKYFNCPGSDVELVKISGDINWMNPFGELSAQLYPFLWYFAVATIGYLIVGCIWMILCAIHWDKLLLLQYVISSILFLGMVESITWYFDFLYYNHHANFHFSAIFIGILSSTLKRTASRLLVLVVSMGFGVVKANLGSSSGRIYLLGSVYFIISFAQQLIVTYLREGENEFLAFLETIFIFPSALLDTIFYWWIFLSLTRTIHQLKLRKQDIKLKMYTRFFNVLFLAAFATVFVILLEWIIAVTASEDKEWRIWWMFQAFWYTLYFVILVVIAFLWRPTANNTRYAYIAAEDIELPLQPISNVKNRKPKDIDTGAEVHLNLDNLSFGTTSFLEDNSLDNSVEESKLQ